VLQISDADQPLIPMSSGRIYRGWWVVLSLFIAGMMIYGAGLYGFTLLIPPLSEQFGWSRAATGGLVSVFWLAAPLTPLGGYFTRRFGANKLILAAILLEVTCMVLVGLVGSLAQLYVVRAMMGVGKVMLMAGVTCQAASWFGRRFGIAIAICFAGWHFGGLMIAPATQILIDSFGWRQSCFIIALAILVIALPPTLLWGWTTSPAESGIPHEDEVSPGPGPVSLAGNPESPDRKFEAGRSPAFWTIVAITVLGGYPYGALLTHEVALVGGAGFSPAMAASAIGLTAGAAIIGSLGMGYLCDRFSFKWAMSAELALMTISVAGFFWLEHHGGASLLLTAALGFGVAVGAFDAGIVAGLRKRYGEQAFKRTFGLWYFFYLMILLLGPIGAGKLFDLTQSYTVAVELMIGTLVAAQILCLLLPAREV
jgi:MFS family permease